MMKLRKNLCCLLAMLCTIIFIMRLFPETSKQPSAEISNKYEKTREKMNSDNTDDLQDPPDINNYTTKAASFTKLNYGPIYVLGVAAGNSSDKVAWDIFKIYASIELLKLKNRTKFKCCFMYDLSNGTQFVETAPKYTRRHKFPCAVIAHHFTCPNKWHEAGILPNGVSLVINEMSCEQQKVNYISPFYPKREPGTKLAIGTKMAFGSIDAELIIEWMETYIYLGVDKVVTYYIQNINRRALKVLQYYESTGILDLYQFVPADSENFRRTFHPPNPQKWNDNRMTVYDSFERMSGYTYFGIIDHDEFLIPSRNRSLKEMLADLYQTFKNMTGFTFRTQFYYLTWGKSGSINDLILGTYINRTDQSIRLNAPKNIYKPNLVTPGGVSTHDIEPDYAMEVVPAEEGYLRHFRECRPQLKRRCIHKFKRVADFEMARWSTRIQHNVHKARDHIFGKDTPNNL